MFKWLSVIFNLGNIKIALEKMYEVLGKFNGILGYIKENIKNFPEFAKYESYIDTAINISNGIRDAIKFVCGFLGVELPDETKIAITSNDDLKVKINEVQDLLNGLKAHISK